MYVYLMLGIILSISLSQCTQDSALDPTSAELGKDSITTILTSNLWRVEDVYVITDSGTVSMNSHPSIKDRKKHLFEFGGIEFGSIYSNTSEPYPADASLPKGSEFYKVLADPWFPMNVKWKWSDELNTAIVESKNAQYGIPFPMSGVLDQASIIRYKNNSGVNTITFKTVKENVTYLYKLKSVLLYQDLHDPINGIKIYVCYPDSIP